jgi:rubrerythrin
MPERKLLELLEQLHEELSRTQSLDEEGRKLLAHLSADIRKFLDPTQETPDSLLERIQAAIDRFEVSHPAITTALSQMFNILSNAGI